MGGLGKGGSEWLACGAALAGRQKEIHASRDQELEEARRQRQIRRQQAGVRF